MYALAITIIAIAAIAAVVTASLLNAGWMEEVRLSIREEARNNLTGPIGESTFKRYGDNHKSKKAVMKCLERVREEYREAGQTDVANRIIKGLVPGVAGPEGRRQRPRKSSHNSKRPRDQHVLPRTTRPRLGFAPGYDGKFAPGYDASQPPPTGSPVTNPISQSSTASRLQHVLGSSPATATPAGIVSSPVSDSDSDTTKYCKHYLQDVQEQTSTSTADNKVAAVSATTGPQIRRRSTSTAGSEVATAVSATDFESGSSSHPGPQLQHW